MMDVGELRSSADLPQDRRQRKMGIFVLAFFAICWLAWFTSVHHHWAGISNHFVAVAFLVLLPCPCISAFVRSSFKSEGFTPAAALCTYVLLLLANSMSPAFL
jgi:hypothetical protein